MEQVNFDINSIDFNNPELIENTNSYMCTAINSKDNSPLSVVFNAEFKCRHDENYTRISTNNKDVVQFINKLYIKIVDVVFEKSKLWFENETTMQDIKNSVIHPVTPNIEDNSLEIMCRRSNITNEEMNKCLIILSGIEFKNDNFYIILNLENISDNSQSTNEENQSDSTEEEPIEEGKTEQETTEQETTEDIKTTDDNKTIEDINTTEELSHEQDISEEDTAKSDNIEILDDVEEIDISVDDDEDNDEMKMNLEKDNLLMIYDILNEKLRLNIYNSVNELFKKKRLDIGDFELEDIIFEDSDDEDTESDDEEYIYE